MYQMKLQILKMVPVIGTPEIQSSQDLQDLLQFHLLSMETPKIWSSQMKLQILEMVHVKGTLNNSAIGKPKKWSSQNTNIDQELVSRFHHTHLQISLRDSYPVVSRTGPMALIPACLNYPLEYSGYRGELVYSRYQMLPISETGEANLFRQHFIYLEQLEDPVRLINCSLTSPSELPTGKSWIQRTRIFKISDDV